MAEYQVLERSFINGRLYEPGAVIDLEIDSPGSNLKPLSLPQMTRHAAATGSRGGGASQPDFTVKHNGGGRWVVIDATGEKVGDFVGASKDDAQAEADRLIAGGEPYVKPDDATTSNGGAAVDDGGNPDDDDDGPDA